MSRKLSALFWCGLFVAVFGSYLLITNLFTLLVISRLSSASTYFGLIIARSALFVTLYALLVAAGVYVMKKGITKVQPPPVEQPTSGPAL
jgi:hypothetical protein